VFFVNIPPGALAVALLLGAYVDPPRGPSRSLDLTGALLAAATAASLLLAIDRHAGASAVVRVGLFVAMIASGLLLVAQQRSAADPLLAPEHLADPAVRAGAAGSLVAGALMYAPAAYVPLWVAREGHGGALRAGASLIPMLLGWSLGSTLGVPVMVRHGMRASGAGGLCIATLGVTGLTLVAWLHLPIVWAALAMLGLGLGPCANAFLLGVQSRVGWSARGAVTALIHAARTLGGSMAVAALGGLSDSGAPRFAALAVVTGVGALLAVRFVPAGDVAGRRVTVAVE
jgi:hypothetical protein